MATLGANYGEIFGRNSLKKFFASSISPDITNNKWEGEIKGGKGDRVNILTYGNVAWEEYTGADITFSDIPEVEGQMILNKQRSNAFRILDWDKFKSYAVDAESTESTTTADLLKQEVDAYNLAFYADTAAGNVVGTDYTTGTVTVTATTGAVVGNGTTFTSAMVGCGFKAATHTNWYRVKTYTNATSIVIEDDKDDEASAYTGVAVAGSTAFTIQGYAKVQVAYNTIDGYILKLKEALDQKGSDGSTCPRSGRFIVVPSKIESIMLQSSQLTPYTPSVAEDVVMKGIIGQYRGFKVFRSEEVTGSNSVGYRVLAGHPMAITHAFVQINSTVVKDLEKNFGKGYKQLVAYGSKVLDQRRKYLATGWFYV